MRGLILVLAAIAAVSADGASQTANQQQVVQAFSSVRLSSREILDKYCVTCHNQRSKTAGVMFDVLDPTKVSDHADVWERAVRKLRTGTMPPQGAPRPDDATYDVLIASLETELDRGQAITPNPGRPLLHRLNRIEYTNAIRDLLALDVDVTGLLPPDDSAFGFDNNADVLGVSPVLLERYLSAADRISALAVGDLATGPGSETYRIRQDLSQDQHIEGLPLGTVGGALLHYVAPLDAEYAVQIKLFRSNLESIRGLEYAHQLEVTVDGERVFLTSIGGDTDFTAAVENPTVGGDAVDARLQFRVALKAGPRAIGVAFLRQIGVGTRRLQPFLRSSADTFDSTGLPHVEKLTVAGPFRATSAGDTPSRRRIFVCRPAGQSDETNCATRIISTLARRAYRRPVSSEDLRPLLAFYQAGRDIGSFESGVEMALRRILASPAFTFRVEPDPVGVMPGATYRISDLELASRLSFFLWSSIPDDQLLTVASQGKLRSQPVLAQQVRRMLADPRAHALVSNFAGQWLQLRNLQRVTPNSGTFPDFDDNLRQAFLRETELFFESVIREDRDVLDLMTADYTFVNERLAKHYGMPNIYGSQFRRVTVTDDARKGLLGKGSILLVTSHADRTSPVVRGKWILDNLLGVPPAPPPPNVPPLKENEQGEAPRTMRDQLAEHRKNPVCANCHKVMDPIGFALENFDAVGAWRTREAGGVIDASGVLADGSKVDGAVMLRQALLKRPEVFVSTFTEKLLTYALGRGLDYHDMPTVRAIVRDAARSDYRFSSIVLGIVTSNAFRMRLRPAQEIEPIVQTSAVTR
jgi:hypothetical protein